MEERALGSSWADRSTFFLNLKQWPAVVTFDPSFQEVALVHEYSSITTPTNDMAPRMVCVRVFVIGAVIAAICPLGAHALFVFMLVWKPTSSIKSLFF